MAIDYKVVGERLKKSRLDKGYTQEMLAEELDLSVAFLSRIERGNSQINLKRLNQICSILGINEATILNGTSVNSNSYLTDDFNNLLKNCPPEKIKLIYEIAKTILEN